MNALKARLHDVDDATRTGVLVDVADALTQANLEFVPDGRGRAGRYMLPSRDALAQIVKDVRSVLFPVHFGPPNLTPDGVRTYVTHRLGDTLLELQEQVRRGLTFACPDGDCVGCQRLAVDVTRAFAASLPKVRELLGSDVRAAYDGDPAATSTDEAVFCYPGITAVTHYRLAHEIHRAGVPLIPRILTELAHGATGIDIHPGSKIGASFFIDHGTGVVIGETSVIGSRVRLYQGVTLGARSVPADAAGRSLRGRARHPIVEDDVTIYAGATVLGRITIGRGSTIGGNVWLTRDVPPGSRISQASARNDVFENGSGI